MRMEQHMQRLVWFSVLFALCSVYAARADLLPSNAAETLDALLKQQAAAADAIQTAYYDYTYRIEETRESEYSPDGRLIASAGVLTRAGYGTVWCRGDYRHEIQEYQESGPAALDARNSIEHIGTPMEWIQYDGSINHAFRYKIALNPARNDPLQSLKQHIPSPDPLERSFLLSSGKTLLASFSESNARHPGVFEWTIAGGDTDPYRIERYCNSKGERWLWGAYTIDQHKGFLITSSRTYDRDGHQTSRCDIDAQQSGGSWIPAKTTVWREDGDYSLTMEITRITVNEPIPDARFVLSSLRAAPDTFILQDIDVKKLGVTKLYYWNTWVPERNWDASMRARASAILRNVSHTRNLSNPDF